MDIVYILGNGSSWENNELCYSLRSLEEYGKNYGNIYIIGEKPDFINYNNVIHIPSDDPYKNKQRNIHSKILTASSTDQISERFVMMNDDIYFLHSYDFKSEIFYYYEYRLIELLRRTTGTKYGMHVLQTIKYLDDKNYFCYDTHYPTVFDKDLYTMYSAKMNWKVEHGYLTKTLYIHSLLSLKNIPYQFQIVHRPDCLIYKEDMFFPNTDIISVSDKGLSNKMKDYLKTIFPNKSKFEL